MSARKIGLLILILGFGALVETAWQARTHIDLGPSGCRVLGGKFYGPSFAFEQEETRELASGTRVEVDNAFGAVRLTAGAPGTVQIHLRKVVFLPTEEKARKFASGIELRTESAAGTLRVLTNRAELPPSRDEVGFETHFTIEVPPETAVAVSNDHGRVDVEDVAEAEVDNSFEPLQVQNVKGRAELKNRHGGALVRSVGGSLSLTARHGDVSVSDVAGRATMDVQHGSLRAERMGALTIELAQGEVSVESVRGDLEVRAKHAPVRARDVSGNANVETTYDEVDVAGVGGEVRIKVQHGEVRATNVKGALVAETSYEGVRLENIAGPVEAEIVHGGLKATGLARGARVKASGDDVTVLGFRGPMEIEARRGSVTLVPAGALTDSLIVSVDQGGIRLEVPPGSRFDLEASSRRGEIEVDVPGLAVSRGESGRVTGALAGGGNPVRLSTEGGDVTVEARSRSAKGEL